MRYFAVIAPTCLSYYVLIVSRHILCRKICWMLFYKIDIQVSATALKFLWYLCARNNNDTILFFLYVYLRY